MGFVHVKSHLFYFYIYLYELIMYLEYEPLLERKYLTIYSLLPKAFFSYSLLV